MVGALVLSLSTLAQAQPSAAAPPVAFTLRLADGRARFHTGEAIAIELEFTSTIGNRFVLDSATYDRSGRLTIDEFRVEPIERVGDPLLDYFAASPGTIGGGLRGSPVLGEKPTVVRLQLNEWFRFDTPGTFRLSARSRRVTDETATGTSRVVAVESNTVAFEIVPLAADWAAATLASAVRTIDSPEPDADRRAGCRILRFLATDAAVDEMIARYDEGRWGCQFEFMAGLFTAPNRDHVVKGMEAALKRSEQPVSTSFLQTLAVLSLYRSNPEFRPTQTAENKGRWPDPGELARRRDLVNAETERYRAMLLASLPGKVGSARALTLADQFESSSRNAASSSVDQDQLRRELTASFLDLPVDRQLRLLRSSWSRLSNPEMLPALRALAAQGPVPNEMSGDIALLRLHQLAPGEGRAAILREVAAPRPGATLASLGSLPDRELRELDDRLAANVESASGFDDFSIRAELLHRYASAAVAPRVLASVRGKLRALACRPKAALLAYFLRADRALGAALLDAALAAREPTGCYTSVLFDVMKLHTAPEVEAAAIAHLQDPSPRVAANAAHALGRYGSPAAVAPLRAAFERWHAEWAGRADELRPRATQPLAEREDGTVEWRLFDALASGHGWLAGRRELETIRAWCVTEGCRANADRMLEMIAAGRLDVTVFDGDQASIALAQYQLESIADLERKLAQYPAGTRFHLRIFAPSAAIEASVADRIRRTARPLGIAVTPFDP
jgi:hypothetical protein